MGRSERNEAVSLTTLRSFVRSLTLTACLGALGGMDLDESMESGLKASLMAEMTVIGRKRLQA